MEEVKKPFSSRFVDDEKFGKELSLKTRRKYYRFLYLIPLLTGVIALTSTFFGLDLSFGGARVLLLINLIILFVTIYMLVWLLKSENTYNVFKKKSYLIWFNIPFYLLMLASCIFSLILSKYHEGEMGYSVDINPFFFICVHLPLFFGYIIFLYFVYYKPFRLYSFGKKSKEAGYDF